MMGRTVVGMAIRETCTKFYLEDIMGRSHTGRPGRKWEDNIKEDLKGVGCDGVDWMLLI
jgi:hypothetical protein